MRPIVSVRGILCTRWTPVSNFIIPNTPLPLTLTEASCKREKQSEQRPSSHWNYRIKVRFQVKTLISWSKFDTFVMKLQIFSEKLTRKCVSFSEDGDILLSTQLKTVLSKLIGSESEGKAGTRKFHSTNAPIPTPTYNHAFNQSFQNEPKTSRISQKTDKFST